MTQMTKFKRELPSSLVEDLAPTHTVDDRCFLAHGVNRPCTKCGAPTTTWAPFFAGYWCNACGTFSELLPLSFYSN